MIDLDRLDGLLRDVYAGEMREPPADFWDRALAVWHRGLRDIRPESVELALTWVAANEGVAGLELSRVRAHALHEARPTCKVVIEATMKRTGLSRTMLLGDQRGRRYARPRQVAMTVASEWTRGSLPQIGRDFGGRHHTTVLHALRKIAVLREADLTIRDMYLDISAAVGHTPQLATDCTHSQAPSTA